MSKDKSIDFLDYLVFLVKWKKFLIVLAISSMVISYIFIYFVAEPQYDSTALILPSEEEGIGGVSSLMKSFSSLPLSVGGLKKASPTDLYITIIYSRSTANKMIKKFDLYKEYDLESWEKTIKQLQKNIITEETNEKAFIITVRGSSPQKSAEMTNFLVEILNESVITLNIKKSRENRIFLENRYNEIKSNLRKAEDEMKRFQKISGVFEAENQIKATIESYSEMEAELALKQIELSVMNKLWGESAPQVKQAEVSVKEFTDKLNEIKSGKKKDSFLIPFSNLSENVMEYFRLYRDLEINNTLLKFIIPLYEQAKFDEQKEVPVFQVIDRATPPEKRSYPKRTIMAFVITLIILAMVIFVLIMREILINTKNEKVIFIKDNLFKFRKI
ncbi:MAG: Wzz/FepE/Etk N-terminal domain-containing protein [Ignavibacteriaceae bacterium]|jgi:capsule polysaccharide export protein KpsE/RkpR|nr:Wzz/FepE/Etk N-terminal domain-containing protein [Ignavibacteriaceae bacterium]